MSDAQKIVVAAKAAGMSTGDFIAKINGLLSVKRCRDTSERLFTENVLEAINRRKECRDTVCGK